ncbi:hypothetical protein AYI68_g1414 [Smittium mucronatum]|uniref:Programmed cell death protein 5 n=1 Tax=Smittium mucronatum TaxID=133383 RepID=A0A1R0H5Q8_9FUNG|nr:hypothetical protein AYI68_g1414 [Smittium mucronatum]
MDPSTTQLSNLSSTGGNGPMGHNTAQAQAQDAETKKKAQEMKDDLMSRILTTEARERLGRIELVRPEKAHQISNMLISMATSGQIKNKIDQDELVSILEQINNSVPSETKIVYSRRSNLDSDDEDEYDL